ncbi:gluconate 2-dehydrogenase gamma chain [Porphyromonadaceae bacterium NLAE-zl-C104]|nr:gluconate 2-dehydrogenase gamma chain [Porphyromonadaceae bacterium NLAE-zl-C104]
MECPAFRARANGKRWTPPPLPPSFWGKINQKEFFNIVLRNTMQGFYGSPRHGGNKNYVSFRMMRLDFPLLIGQNRYEE